MKSKELKDYTFDELVDHAAGGLLQDILQGTKFRTAAWRAVEIGVRWRDEQNIARMKEKRKK